MSTKRSKLSSEQLSIIKDKQYRLLKNLLYKYQIPIKSVMQKPREDNFIAYSIVQKVSNSGWFTNERLLALDCASKEIFYLTKIPNFIIDEEENPLQIENLRSSALVKERISLNSFAKQVKSVVRNQHVLTIQWESQAPQCITKKWVIEMTSSQLAKDWENLITILEKGKLSDPSSVKKVVVTPENIQIFRKQTPNVLQTQKSLSDIHSIHMKSQNMNLQGEDINNIPQKKEYVTQTNKGESLMIKYAAQNNKFLKKKMGQQGFDKNNLKDMKTQKLAFANGQGSGNHKANFALIAKELSMRPPDYTDKDLKHQFNPLSQEIQNPFNLQFGKIKKNSIPNEKSSQNLSGKFMKLHLLKNQIVPSNSVISEFNMNLSNRYLLSEELRSINSRGLLLGNRQTNNLEFESSLKRQGKKIMINQIPTLKQSEKKRPEVATDFAQSQSNKSPYWNTYHTIKDLPKLESIYDWNEIYFKILLQYYNLCCFPKNKNDENRLFDILFKLEKHVQKFELYCEKGIRNFIDQQILNFEELKPQNQPNNFYVKNVKEENFYVSQDVNIKEQPQNNLFNENLQVSSVNSLFNSFGKGITLLIEKVMKPVKMRQKIIHFQFEGIHFKVILDQNQLFISNAEKEGDFSFRSNQFYQLSDIIKSEWEGLFNISYLNPYFVEGSQSQSMNYFHIFTPMIAVIQYHGLNFYCQAEFNPLIFDRYVKLAMNSAASLKNTEDQQNIKNYLQQNFSNTSLTYFPEDKLIDRIITVNLCKQPLTTNYFVIDQIKNIENQEEKSIQYSEKQRDVKEVKKNNKFIEIIACLQKQFINTGGVRLTSHQTFKNFMLSLVPENILSEKHQIKKLYNLLMIQAQKNKEKFFKKDGSGILFNHNFVNYMMKLLENEIVICLLLDEINLVVRVFLADLHIGIRNYKLQLIKEDPHFVSIYKASNNDQTSIIFINDFQWSNLSKSNQQNRTFESFVRLNDLRSFTNQQLSQLILNLIVNKAVSEIFLLEKNKINNTEIETDRQITFTNDVTQWILEKCTQFNLNKNNVNNLDKNFIYEGILYELGIEKYFDPIDPRIKNLENEYRILKSSKTQVQKLIRDPYFPSFTNQTFKKSQLIELTDSKKSNGPTKSQRVEYIARLSECQESRSSFRYGVSRVSSLLHSFPLVEVVKQSKICSDLQQIHSLILEKDFSSSIEIYYLLINSNKKSSQIYYEYFKNAKHNQDKLLSTNQSSTSPALVTYVLATQCVAFAFLQLLQGKMKKISQNQQQKNTKMKRIVPVMIEGKKNQNSQGEKSQFQALILKYNEMSHFGAEIIYGKNHIIYFINQVIFGITKIMSKEINEGSENFDQCLRIILQKPDIFEYKYLILPVLYHKAQNDLRTGSYRAAILTVRIIMKCIQLFKQPSKILNEASEKNQYWIEPYLTEVLQGRVPDLENNSLENKLNYYNYFCYQILILCNENDPDSDIKKNRKNIKIDIINQLKSHHQQNKNYVKYLKLLWSLEVKLMLTDRKWLIRRALVKLYDKIVEEIGLKNEILNYNLKILLDPLGSSKFSTDFLNTYALFEQIFSKSDKYFNFFLTEFQNPQFHEFYEFLLQKMSNSSKKVSESSISEHYELKRDLFKDIILMMKLTLMVDMKFILQTMASSDKLEKIVK